MEIRHFCEIFVFLKAYDRSTPLAYATNKYEQHDVFPMPAFVKRFDGSLFALSA
jgi:hypothetical protein